MELAQRHLNLKPSPTERELDPSRIKFLVERAEAGQLVTFNWAVAKLGQDLMRMNGQHSSTMLAGLNGTFPKDLKVHLDTYYVETAADLAVLFRQFDARKSSRTPSDVSGAFQGLYPNLEAVPREIAKLAIEGVHWYLKHVEGVLNLSGDDRYTLFEDTRYHPFIEWMGEIHSIKTKEMRRIPVASAMYSTFDTNPEKARQFWNDVSRGGVEFDDEAPATVVDNWLKLAADADERRKLHLKDGNYWQACIHAWQAFLQGKRLAKVQYRVDKGLMRA
jgi:hypothetical protein